MAEKASKKSKRAEPKMKSKKYDQPEYDDMEETEAFNPVMQQQQMEKDIFKPPSPLAEFTEKTAALPTKQKQRKFVSEPVPVYKKKMPQSLPVGARYQEMAELNDFLEQEHQLDSFQAYDLKMLANGSPRASVPLPPITSTQNFNDILPNNMKVFKVSRFKLY
jgi:hypothetical protein